MPAFVVFVREQTLDQAELRPIGARSASRWRGRPVKVLAAYGRHVPLEGSEVEGAVIAEFPSIEEARAWYESPAYREAAAHRFRGADYRGVIVEGV